jgi:hypothetical protein
MSDLVVRQPHTGKFAIGTLDLKNRRQPFTPRDSVRFDTRQEAEDALRAEQTPVAGIPVTVDGGVMV